MPAKKPAVLCNQWTPRRRPSEHGGKHNDENRNHLRALRKYSKRLLRREACDRASRLPAVKGWLHLTVTSRVIVEALREQVWPLALPVLEGSDGRSGLECRLRKLAVAMVYVAQDRLLQVLAANPQSQDRRIEGRRMTS